MSGQVVAGLVSSGAIVLTWGAVMARKGPAAQRYRAGRFAVSAGLVLPPELVPWVAARLRRRALIALAVTGPLMAAGGYWYLYVLWGDLDSPDPGRMPPLGPMDLPAGMAIMAAGAAVAHARDVAAGHLARVASQ